MAVAKIILADTESNRDLFYATRIPLHDPHLFVDIDGETFVFGNPLEAGRLKKAKLIDHVLDPNEYLEMGQGHMRRARKYRTQNSGALILHALLKAHGVKRVLIPKLFNVPIAKGLEDLQYTVAEDANMYPERQVKTAAEVKHIQDAVERTEEAIWIAYEILSNSIIQKDRTLVHLGNVVTAEMLKGAMGAYLIKFGYLAKDTIVAPGIQACDPHEQGHGPIRANELIVIDIFPGSMEHGYYADISRTFLKGKPSERQAAMYAAVLDAQLKAEAIFRPGVAIRSAYERAMEVLTEAGFETEHDIKKGPYGFFHGLSHGLGLAVHDPISQTEPLVAGNVISNEPGLYYPDDGGVRLEDDILITSGGSKNLCSFPKDNWIIA